ncbi:MAG: hypothetical protein Q8L89_02765 [Gammaproteobacteria bacterium]|nr:hypothetical protein [Gammaproteobacteria bacterium]
MDILSTNELIAQDLAVINEQITFHEKRAASTKSNDWRQKLHLQTAEKLRSVSDHIIKLQSDLAEATNCPKPIKIGNQLSLNYAELKGLPDELIQELSIDTDRTEFTIIELIDEAGGLLSLDKILVGLYKKTGDIHKRTLLNNRLYRMVQRGELFSVSGKKGVYSTRVLSDNEMEEILNYKPRIDKGAEDLP